MRHMYWDCDKGGPGKNCFNRKKRLKFGVFDGCFPHNINFSDVDGLVHLAGKFCLLEWKGNGVEVPWAQRLAYESFTRNTKNIVFIVYGDAEDMTVQSFGYYRNGIYVNAVDRTLDDLKKWLRRWADWAETEKVEV